MPKRKYPGFVQPPRDGLRTTLEILGYAIEASPLAGSRSVTREGRLVMMGPDEEIWRWLRRSGQIR